MIKVWHFDRISVENIFSQDPPPTKNSVHFGVHWLTHVISSWLCRKNLLVTSTWNRDRMRIWIEPKLGRRLREIAYILFRRNFRLQNPSTELENSKWTRITKNKK